MSVQNLNPHGVDPLEPIFLGSDPNGQPMYIDYPAMANHHIGLVGKSGSGKTYTIQHLIDQMIGRGMTVNVIQFHREYDYENFAKSGATRFIGPESFNTINFEYHIGDGSINPMKFISTGSNSGGVFMAIQEVISCVKLWKSSLGEIQEAYLTQILEVVYQKKGILKDDPSTWNPRADFPELTDVLSEIDKVLFSLKTGIGSSVIDKMQVARKSAQSLDRRIKSGKVDSDAIDAAQMDLEEEINKLKDLASESVGEFINSQAGEYFHGWDEGVIHRLKQVMRSMVNSELFTKQSRGPIPGKVNVFEISTLSLQHQSILTNLFLRRFYTAAMATCRELNPKAPNTYVVVDEGRYLELAAKSATSPANEIAGGARKFGFSLLLGGQNSGQFSLDMRTNFGATMLLPINETAFADARKHYSLTQTQLSKLQPRHNLWLSMNNQRRLITTFR